MAEYNLGRVAFFDKGAYSPEDTYNKWDFVTTVDSTYLFIGTTPQIGKPVTDTNFWKCIANGKPATLAAAAADLAKEAANSSATLANEKAVLAQSAATLANTKAGLADAASILATDKAGLADSKATLANDKAALAQSAADNANAKAAEVTAAVLSAGSLGSIKPTDAAPTPARNGNYTFSIGGDKPAWLTAEAGVTTVKAGDGVAVVFTAPSSYTYTHVNTGSSIEQTRSQSTSKVPSSKLLDDELVQFRSDLSEAITALNQEQIQGGVYDVSSHNDGAVFESLSTLLGSANLSALIPTSVRRGGMSIRFIQGSVPNSDNKYVQYRLMANAFSLNVSDWQGVDNEPTTESHNLVTFKALEPMYYEDLLSSEKNTLIADHNTQKWMTYAGSHSIIWNIEGAKIINILTDAVYGYCFLTEYNPNNAIENTNVNPINPIILNESVGKELLLNVPSNAKYFTISISNNATQSLKYYSEKSIISYRISEVETLTERYDISPYSIATLFADHNTQKWITYGGNKGVIWKVYAGQKVMLTNYSLCTYAFISDFEPVEGGNVNPIYPIVVKEIGTEIYEVPLNANYLTIGIAESSQFSCTIVDTDRLQELTAEINKYLQLQNDMEFRFISNVGRYNGDNYKIPYPLKKGQGYHFEIVFDEPINAELLGFGVTNDTTLNTSSQVPLYQIQYIGDGFEMNFQSDDNYNYIALTLKKATSNIPFKVRICPNNFIQSDKIIVSASNSKKVFYEQSNFICNGNNDEYVINYAIQTANNSFIGKVLLHNGNYKIDSFPFTAQQYTSEGNVPRNVAIIIPYGKEIELFGDNCEYSYMDGATANNGTIIEITQAAYNSIQEGDLCSVVRGQHYSSRIISSALKIHDIGFVSYDNGKDYIMLDFNSIDRLYAERLILIGFGKDMASISYNNPPSVPSDGFVGIKLGIGSNDPQGYCLSNIGVWGFGEGFQMGGEHTVAIQCAATVCKYGYTFGNYDVRDSFAHPITMINCCDERNINLPLFEKCGTQNQNITMIDFNLEIEASNSPGGVLGDKMVCNDNHFRGEISFSEYNASGLQSQTQLWESGQGHNFKTRNTAHLQSGTTALRESYYPQYLQEYYDETLDKMVIYNGSNWVDFNGTVV